MRIHFLRFPGNENEGNGSGNVLPGDNNNIMPEGNKVEIKSTDNEEEKEISFPTKPDAEGWFYDNSGEHSLDMETRVDEETELVYKRIKLLRGRVAIVRMLNNKEKKKAMAIAGKKKDLVLPAYISLAAVITDKNGKEVSFVAEDIDTWMAKDVNRLETACSLINF